MTWQDHHLDEDGEHDPESCYPCQLRHEVPSTCRCAECCKRLLIEVLPEDAEREPLIKDKGSPIYSDERLTGKRELEGYLLSGAKGCVFLNPQTSLCTI